MMSFWNRITARRSVQRTESDGLTLALATVEDFKHRTFRFKGMGMKASRLPAAEVTRFIRDEMPDYYNYTSRVTTRLDMHCVRHAAIEITGTMGVSRGLNRYNPLDVTCTIKTEKPKVSDAHDCTDPTEERSD